MSVQPLLDEVIAWATQPEHHEDLVAARAVHRQQTGEAFDDERQFETRLTSFLEWYVCDRVAPWLQKTPARARYELALKTESPERARSLRALTETTHALFDVQGVGAGSVQLVDLLTGIDYSVAERRQHLGFGPGDIVEARLVPWDEHWVFTQASCWHPSRAAQLLRAEAKRRRQAGKIDELERLVHDAAQRSLKAERYRQIALEKIYDFVAPRL